MKTLLKASALLLIALFAFPSHSFAWGRKGHEVVAYIAYQNLDDPTRKQVDYLVTLNPCYTQWLQQVATIPKAQQPVALFMLAATWPDLIKLPAYSCQPDLHFVSDGGPNASGHFSEDFPPSGPEASQNIGYSDDRRHKYWHFVNAPFSPADLHTSPATEPDALTEVVLLTQALHSDESNDLKSYDMVWLEHLVGDMHQPLHNIARYTAANPLGDAGGNDVAIVQSPNDLHGYWDNLPGPDNLKAALQMGQLLNAGKAPTAKVLDLDDPSDWTNDSFKLAQQYAYASPVSAGAVNDKPSNLNSSYQAKALQIAKSQIFLAGRRLAALLNEELA